MLNNDYEIKLIYEANDAEIDERNKRVIESKKQVPFKSRKNKRRQV
ncbi:MULTISPECIES: hypothetical protein [Bacillaceae]|nr:MULTISPECIES: hypothetical protein [Bacillaceae]MDX8361801.1 hypothetical protein [Cytobacillus sp. IB215316]